MAEKTTIRALFAIAAAIYLQLEHFDISGAYLHEQLHNAQPVYVWQRQRFDGSYKHDTDTGELKGNIYGTPSAAHTYITRLYADLTENGYVQSQSDLSLFTIRDNEHYLLVAVSMDDFITATNDRNMTEHFYATLTQKYKVKRLGVRPLISTGT